MAIENDFLVFAGASGANVVAQSAYAGQGWQTGGFGSGIAQSAQLNKVWRQASIMGAMLAQFIVDKSGQPAIDDGTTATLEANLTLALQTLLSATLGHGQCRLSVASATSLKLSQFNGQNLIINGTPQSIPSAGVTITNAGLSASTLYYVYAYLSGSTMALEVVTTTHVTGTNGVEQKSGDATRTLVGMVYTNASAQFVDSPTSRTLLNWFNRRALGGAVNTTGSINFTNTSIAEISTAVRVGFLAWADESIHLGVNGEMTNNTAAQSVVLQSYVDGAAWGPSAGAYIPSANGGTCYSSVTPGSLAEGYHQAEVFGSVTGGTGTSLTMSNFVMTRG